MTSRASDPNRRLPGAVWLAGAILVWFFSSKAIQDVALFVAFLYALWRDRRIPRIWLTFPGCIAVSILLLALVTTPLSVSPQLSLRALVKVLDAVAVLYAVPILLGRGDQIERALLWSGVAFSCVIGLDLLRVFWFLGTAALGAAHEFEPFMVVHSNISASLAAVGCLTMGFFAFRCRREGWRAVACLLAAAVNLAYLVVIASRGPQIAFAAALASAGFLSRRWSHRVAWLFALVLAGSLLYANLARINPRFADTTSLKTFVDRDKVWQHTWSLARNRPILGYGVGKGVFMQTYHGSNPPRSPFNFQHPHQYWLYVLFAQGLVGVALHLALWCGVTWRLLRDRFRPSEMGAPIPVSALILVLCVFFHVYALADWPAGVLHLYMAWLVPAALVVTSRPAPGQQTPTAT